MVVVVVVVVEEGRELSISFQALKSLFDYYFLRPLPRRIFSRKSALPHEIFAIYCLLQNGFFYQHSALQLVYEAQLRSARCLPVHVPLTAQYPRSSILLQFLPPSSLSFPKSIFSSQHGALLSLKRCIMVHLEHSRRTRLFQTRGGYEGTPHRVNANCG